MLRHRLKGDEEGQDDPEETKLKLSGKKGKEFKISDADDIMMVCDVFQIYLIEWNENAYF